MHGWCIKRKGPISNSFIQFLILSFYLSPLQAADAALPTLDGFVAGMHWMTYRASEPKILKSNDHSAHVFIISSFASSWVMAS